MEFLFVVVGNFGRVGMEYSRFFNFCYGYFLVLIFWCVRV